MSPAELAAAGRCARARDGGLGPRACGELGCPSNLRAPAAAGPAPAAERLRLQAQTADSCAEDVAEVVRRTGENLSFAAIGRHLGCSPQSAHATYQRALRKARASGALE